MDAATLFENTMDWLRDSYGEHRFFLERDIVWTAQLRLLQEVEQANLSYQVFNDYKIQKGAPGADLVILDGDSVAVAAEFKYEPSPKRKAAVQPKPTGSPVTRRRAQQRVQDILTTKLPLANWREIEKDFEKVRGYFYDDSVTASYAILIDEGAHWRCRHPNAPEGSEWRDWGNGVWALWTERRGGDSPREPDESGTRSEESHQIEAQGDWVPLSQLNVDLPQYPRSPARLRFPDNHEHPVKSWKDLLFGTACWLASVGSLTERNAPVAAAPHQPPARQRYIVSADRVHGSGKPFAEPFEIPGTPLIVETMVDKRYAKAHSIKLLERCGVDPNAVLVLR